MRTRDAVADEVFAAKLAFYAGGDCCPTIPMSATRKGWEGNPLSSLVNYTTPQSRRRAERDWNAGMLARLIWESLPDEHRWWLHGGRAP